MSGVRAQVVDVLSSMQDLPYLGEAVSQLEHSLQCGYQLRAMGADDDVVLAGVLHDVGRAKEVVVVGEPHEITGEAWVRARFGERMGWLVGSHVPAKKVLVAIDGTYASILSKTSVATLRVQGGPATDEEVETFMAHPWADDALKLRRADDLAKVVDAPELTLEDVGDLVDRVVAR
jgi:predicted HD phosphohydrolase